MAAGRDITIYQGMRPEPAIDAEAAIEAYLARVREVYRRLNLDVLGPSGMAGEQPVIELRQVYIPQDYGNYRAQSPESDWSAPIRSTDLRMHLRLPILQLLAEYAEPRIVIIGDPGGGKSTLTKFLALALAGALDRVPSELTPMVGLVPVVVELRQYAQHQERTIEEFLEFIHAQERMGLPRRILSQLFGDGQALVAFDGLDEIFDPELRATVSRRIAAFTSAYPRVRTIVTSREHGYLPSPFISAGFRHVKLRNLDDSQVTTFTRRWYTAAHPADPARAAQLTERLLHAVRNIRAVGELAGNPLLLTVLAAIGLGHTIPRERRNVYAHAIEVLIERWDRDAKFLTPSGPSNAEAAQALEWLNTNRRLKLLERIARRMQSDAGRLAGTFIHHDELTGLISEFFIEHNIGRPAAEIAADSLVERLRTRNFLLAHYGGGIYGFVHRTFLEYLASSDLVRRRDEEEWSREDFIDLLDEYSKDPAWHEVVLLTAGRLKQRDVAAFLARLLERHRSIHRPRNSPPLVFAIRVLAEVDEISAQADPRTSDDHLSVSAQSDAIIDALTIALRRESMLNAEEALPALATFDRFWSGRQRYLHWYHSALSGSGTHAVTTGVLIARRLCLTDGSTVPLSTVRWHPLATKIISRSDPADDLTDGPWSEPLQALVDESIPQGDAIAVVKTVATQAPDAATRVEALAFLAEYWPEDHHAARIVEAAAGDTSPEVRIRALRLLSGSWPFDNSLRATFSGATPLRMNGPQVERSSHHSRLTVQAATTDDEPLVRIEALQSLGYRWLDHPDTVPTLRTAAGDHDPAVRAEALRLVALLPSISSPDLRAATDDPAPTVRVTALLLLCEYWREGADTHLAVRNAAGDTHPDVRTEALRLLADGWAGHSDTRPTVHNATGDPAPAVRAEALRLLGEYWPDHPDSRPAAATALADDEPEVRVAALQVLAARFTEAAFRPALDLARQDASDDVRMVAVKLLALAWPEEPESVATITSLLTDPSEPIRTVAHEALSVLGLENPLA